MEYAFLLSILNQSTGICTDSRIIGEKEIFVALKGIAFDGNQFIENIISIAAFIVTDEVDVIKKFDYHPKIILVDDSKAALNYLLSNFYTKLPKYLIAVTGTNGKTSVVNYIRQICYYCSKSSASIGTLGIQKDNDVNLDNFGLTTMDAVNLYKTLSNLAQNNHEFVALEASSHGIDQERLGLLKFDVGIFTSFSQDHLDYHKNLEHYFASKFKLFSNHLKPESLAIISKQVSDITNIEQELSENKISYLNVGKDCHFSTKITKIGQEVSLEYKNKIYKFNTSIVGHFQLCNLVQAVLAATYCGINLDEIVKILSKVKAPKGRLEKITDDDAVLDVFIDYAHTPDALELTLKTLRAIVSEKAKLIVIFGCGGDRDKSKRPIMGQIAQLCADIVIITDDNPRSEDARQIRQQIISAAPNAIEIENRKLAIEYVINTAKENDVIVIAGKGHENYQIIGNKKYDFSDEEEVLKCLAVKNLK